MNARAHPASSTAGGRRRSVALLLKWTLLLLAATPALAAPSFLDWKGLEPGPFAVGFNAVATTDATRTFQTPTDYQGRPRPAFGNRPVQISIWYPAQTGPGDTSLTYGDYVALLGWELQPEQTGPAARRTAEEQFLQMAGTPATAAVRAAFADLFRTEVHATRGAAPAPGRHPVLLCAPGQGYPAFDNSVLAEFLASHGFIVLASPSAGPDGRDMPDNATAIDTGARDLEYLAGYAQSLPQADAGRLAAMGFSLGGASAALFTARNARVQALISLDSVLRDDRYPALLKTFPQFGPENLRASILWIACSPTNSPPGFADGSLLEQAKYAEVVKVVFGGMRHHDFSSMSTLQRRRAGGPAADWAAATAGYESACRLILAFLESRLGGAVRPLAPEPPAQCTISVRAAAKAPPTVTDFRDTAARDGLSAAAELLLLIRKDHPNLLPPFEEALILLGYEALGANKGPLAIEAFTLTVATFPESIDGSYGLGKAYRSTGASAQARPHYVEARAKVEKDPRLPAEQKAGILSRIDKILDEIDAKTAR